MKKIHILLIEDNEGDILLTTDAFEQAHFVDKISIVKDGKEAMDFLVKTEKFKDALSPDLMLLDINLPKKNGLEVLQFIKNNDNLKHIPVIMFTTSSTNKDIKASYQNYANCYITKPIEVDGYADIILQIEEFWFKTVKLPTK